MGYGKDLDFVGQNSRRRKVRTISQTTNEPDQVTPLQLRGAGYTVESRPLLLGDYAWDLDEGSFLKATLGFSGVVVERKTLADLRDVKRLVSQMQRMVASKGKEFFIVLIEYIWDKDSKRRWAEKSVLNAELSIQLRGIYVTRCDANAVASRLDALYMWSQKSRHLVGESEEEKE